MNSCKDDNERLAGLAELLKLKEELAGKEAELKGKEAELKAELKGKDELLKGKDELLKTKEELLHSARMDTLRAKGLLSSRGIVERVLQLCHTERGMKGKFNATATINALGTPSEQIRRWEQCVRDTVTSCHTGTSNITPVLQNLFNTLSNEIHGQPWSTNTILIDDSLPQQDKCIIEKLCRHMGLL